MQRDTRTMPPDLNLLDSRTLMMAVYKSGELFLLVDEDTNNRVHDEQAIEVSPAIIQQAKFDDFGSLPLFPCAGTQKHLPGPRTRAPARSSCAWTHPLIKSDGGLSE